MVADSLTPDRASGIKQAKMGRVGLAGQKWPISHTPLVTHLNCIHSSNEDHLFMQVNTNIDPSSRVEACNITTETHAE
jgi:hypothetical protein